MIATNANLQFSNIVMMLSQNLKFNPSWHYIIQSITRGIARKTLPLLYEDIPYNAIPYKQGIQNHAYLEISSSNDSHPCAKKILAERSHLLSMLYRFPSTKLNSSAIYSLTATSTRSKK